VGGEDPDAAGASAKGDYLKNLRESASSADYHPAFFLMQIPINFNQFLSIRQTLLVSFEISEIISPRSDFQCLDTSPKTTDRVIASVARQSLGAQTEATINEYQAGIRLYSTSIPTKINYSQPGINQASTKALAKRVCSKTPWQSLAGSMV
jgi:hypothetical protein